MLYIQALLAALFGWWFCTGIILFLNHLPTRTYRWSILGATILMVLSVFTVSTVGDDLSRKGVLLSFVQGLLVWGWLEITYLMGFLTGPLKEPCPKGIGEWRRFWLALKTSLYHEVAVVAFAILLIYLTFDKQNPLAGYTFVTLWLMRWSAKLNLFLGVLNYNSDWLPSGISYLKSYVRFRRMNVLFPVSVCIGVAAATFFFLNSQTSNSDASSFSSIIIGVLIGFAVLEHCFLMLPINDAVLWNWVVPRSGQDKIKKSNS